MRSLTAVVAGIVMSGLALCEPARAGTVTRTSAAVTYQADAATGAGEAVTLGVANAMMSVASDRGVTASSACTQIDPERVECPPAPAFVVNLLGFEDSLTADAVLAAATIEAHGGAGADRLNGALSADRLFGDDGGDQLDGKAGADMLDGGAGDDAISGGPGADQIAGGADADTIEARDGEVDAIDCGAGNDTALADVGDVTTNCEAGVDFDGDGSSGNADCAPTDRAIGPAAQEIPGNAIDENCDGVVAPALALPDFASFAGSPKSLRVSRTRRFAYSFAATPARAGRLRLTSTRAIRIGSKKRRLTFGKAFAAPPSGKVRLSFRMSAVSFRALKRVTSLQFGVRVTVGSKVFTTKLRLRPPKRKRSS